MTPNFISAAWRPVLSGALRRRALEVVKEIAASLPRHIRREETDESLASGKSGLAVTYAYMARSGIGNNRETAEYLNRARQLISSSIRQDMSSEVTMPSLHCGFTGAAWSLTHLQREAFGLPRLDSKRKPSRILDAALCQDPANADYDLIDGLVGWGVYALERLPDPAATACLNRIVEQLSARAVYRPDGIAFAAQTSQSSVLKSSNQTSSYDLGVAHGVAGVIGLLAAVCSAGVAYENARALLSETVKWLISQKMESNVRGCFPYFVGPGIRRKRARLAWCYGDAGIAAVLLLAARSTRNSSWEREALRIAHSAAERRADKTGVIDAGLCHGSAGLGHIFNRIYQATGKTWSQKAACFWFTHALDQRRSGKGVAGFLSYTRDDNNQSQWTEEIGLLEGAAGIALALLSAASSTVPSWDRILLLSHNSSTTTKKHTSQKTLTARSI